MGHCSVFFGLTRRVKNYPTNEIGAFAHVSGAAEVTVVMITYNIYIVIRETGQFSSKGIINDFIGNLNRLTVSRRFTEQAV